jgi:hypothetical protein
MASRLNHPEITACHHPDTLTSGEFKPLPDTAECCIGCIKPVSRTRSPSARRAVAAPPRREPLNELKPPAAFRITARRTQLRRPGPARSVTSTRTIPPPALTATMTVSPGAPEPLCRTELTKTSLTSKTATSPYGCPGPSTSETNARAVRARSTRPASVTLSRTASPAITAPALPRPPRPVPGNQPGSGGTQGHARSPQPRTSSRHNRIRGPRPWPARRRGPVRDRP